MLHKMNMDECDHCGRIVEEEKIDELGICRYCYERASIICYNEEQGDEGEADEY